MSETLQHLVLVRHGESEGDVRRAAWKQGKPLQTNKLPEQEELTDTGIKQSRLAGLWVQQHIINAYNLINFDGCYVSTALRSEQSAVAMELPITVWQDDNCLDERNRGLIRGLRKQQHEQKFPESFQEMTTNPLRWLPPEGESLLEVARRAGQFLDNIEGERTVLAVGHRDWIWAAQLILEKLSEEELLAVDTNAIHNAQIIHYTSIDPLTGKQAPELLWKRSVDPLQPELTSAWQTLPHTSDIDSLV